tara:strand:+ start:5840 stop:7750 length:1911 start_codon:yes stop_codon:yes gene_type:complete
MRGKGVIYILLIVIVGFFGCSKKGYHLTVSKLYADNMIIQRNQPIKVWGKVNEGAKVKIQFNNKQYETISTDSSWFMELPEMKAGGPYEMSIMSGANHIQIKNILIGDVWVCSGQSNMEWMVKEALDAENELTQATDTQIRQFKIPHSGSEEPSDELENGNWTVNHPDSTGNFTAVGYYFAKELRKEIDVPIGLINTSWGGSRIESWINPELLLEENRSKEEQIAIDSANVRFVNNLQNVKKSFPQVTSKDGGVLDGEILWADFELDDTDWGTIAVPSIWEDAGFPGLDGIGWYRMEFELTEEEAAETIELGLGEIDDCDRSFVNGVEIGGYCDWESPRVYKVNQEILKAGENNITIRVEDGGGGGGIAGEQSMLYVKTKNNTMSLAGNWKFRVGATVNMSFAGMYNKMVHPLTKFPIKGVLWYQGESNTNTIDEAEEYEYLFSELINNWRFQWNQGEFPFLFVQLPNFYPTPLLDNWAVLRNSQSKVLELSNVGQAVTIDIGEANNIHPKNKKDFGYRLSLAALKIAYDKDIVFSGPIYKSHTIQGNKIIIDYNHIGSGLMSRSSEDNLLKEFEVAGVDNVFVAAKSLIRGDNIIVWDEKIKNPKHVRYAWSDNPEKANLYNKEGLPASPFRTNK